MKKVTNKKVNFRKQLKVKLQNTATRYKNKVGYKPTPVQAYHWFRVINRGLFNSRLPMVPLHVRKLHKDWGRCVANWDNRKTPKGKFNIECRGMIDVKGKGEMKTYILKHSADQEFDRDYIHKK